MFDPALSLDTVDDCWDVEGLALYLLEAVLNEKLDDSDSFDSSYIEIPSNTI
jgi:hypothetical protein